MIVTEETTFVIGAGASFPYGYPIGQKLKKYICEEHCNELAGTISKLMCPEYEQEEYAKRIRSFQKYFWNCPYTIDKFMRINPEFNVIGKQLIAASLFPKEDSTLLNKIEKDNWYLSFADLIDLSFDNITKNKMNIITFNYDRSLEEFLFRSLFYLHSMKKKKEDCRDKINKLSIIHTYGYLAPLGWKDEEFGREYRVKALTREDMVNAVNNITIIGENIDSSTAINSQIKVQLGNVKKREAEKIIRRKRLNEKCQIKFDNVEVSEFFKEHIYLN